MRKDDKKEYVLYVRPHGCTPPLALDSHATCSRASFTHSSAAAFLAEVDSALQSVPALPEPAPATAPLLPHMLHRHREFTWCIKVRARVVRIFACKLRRRTTARHCC